MENPEKKINDRPLSPEQLDKRLVVVNPRGWIALALTLFLILGAIGWAIFGQIPNTMETEVILLNERGFEIIKATESGFIRDIPIKRRDTINKGEIIAHIESEGKIYDIAANEPGMVVEVFGVNGQKVNRGDFLASIQRKEGKFSFFGFLPLDKGQQIQTGMTAYIQPTGINVREYGSIIGEVDYVSPYVVSHAQLLELLGDEAFISYFTENKPVLQIIIDPLKNEEAVSGYQWTSGNGPNEKVYPLTVAKGLIVLQSRKPITYIIPTWRFKSFSSRKSESP